MHTKSADEIRKTKIILLLIISFVAITSVWYLSLVTNSAQPIKFSSNASEYKISSSKNPYFTQAIIDPLDVHVGDIQKMLVKVQDPHGVAWVLAAIERDNGVTNLSLKRISGDEKDGVWYGDWIVHDTHRSTYHTIFTARNVEGQENSITLAWSDPCSGISLGGDGSLTASCTVSGTDGVDSGNLNLNGYTLTINSGGTFAWNSAKSITVGSGSIAIASGGQLKQTNLWIRDADNDAYAPSATDQLAQDSQPANYRRRNTASGTADCNDADATKYQYLTGYQDSDGDTFTTGSAQNVCSGSSLPSGWRSTANGNDCNDADATKWQNLAGYQDGDGDTFTVGGVQNVCSGNSLPSGWRSSQRQSPTAASGLVSQSFSNGWAPAWMYSASDSTVSARRFQASPSYWLKKVSLAFARADGTQGWIWVTIEDDSGGMPSGTARAGGTSNYVDFTNVCVWGACVTWIDFTFPGVELTAGTNYWIVLRGSFTGAPHDGVGYHAIIHWQGLPLDSNPGAKSLARSYANPTVWTDSHSAGWGDLWYMTYAGTNFADDCNDANVNVWAGNGC